MNQLKEIGVINMGLLLVGRASGAHTKEKKYRLVFFGNIYQHVQLCLTFFYAETWVIKPPNVCSKRIFG